MTEGIRTVGTVQWFLPKAGQACFRPKLAEQVRNQKAKKGEKMKEGRLGYNNENDRYGIIDGDFWENDGLHCGETLEILIEDEMDSNKN